MIGHCNFNYTVLYTVEIEHVAFMSKQYIPHKEDQSNDIFNRIRYLWRFFDRIQVEVEKNEKG